MDRSALAARIFDFYDRDKSGTLDADELTVLLRTYEPRLDTQGIRDTIARAAPNCDVMDQPAFERLVLRENSHISEYCECCHCTAVILLKRYPVAFLTFNRQVGRFRVRASH